MCKDLKLRFDDWMARFWYLLDFEGHQVPEVLLGGHHEKIKMARQEEQTQRAAARRLMRMRA